MHACMDVGYRDLSKDSSFIFCNTSDHDFKRLSNSVALSTFNCNHAQGL